MTLTAHAIIGTAVATISPNPILGFILGFASHFLIDAIPHWDYPLSSMKEDKENPMNTDMTLNRDFITDLFRIGLDFVLGIVVSVLLFVVWEKHSYFILWGAVGGLLPDALQFLYMKWRHEPLTSYYRFHSWVHGKKIENHAFGIFSQLALMVVVVMVFGMI